MRRILSSFREGLSWGQLSPAEAPQKAPYPPWLPCQPSVNGLRLGTKVLGSWALSGSFITSKTCCE